MAKVDDDTLETHFALGHLFRRRGEVERAIRVHENLARAAEPQRDAAAPGDVLARGGLSRRGVVRPRRAARLNELRREPDARGGRAREARAISTSASRSGKRRSTRSASSRCFARQRSNQVAHYYCELADQARAAGDRELAREHLEGHDPQRIRPAARHADPRGTRAGRRRLHARPSRSTSRSSRRTGTSSGGAAAADGMLPQHRQAAVLRGQDRQNGSRATRHCAATSHMAAIVGRSRRFATRSRAASRDSCSVTTCSRRLVNAAELELFPPTQRRSAIERITQSLREIAMASARYRCSNCGYSTQRFIWHCPSCKLWETVRPIQSAPLETMLICAEPESLDQAARLRCCIGADRRLAWLARFTPIGATAMRSMLCRSRRGARLALGGGSPCVRGPGQHQHGRRGHARERAHGRRAGARRGDRQGSRRANGNFAFAEALARVKGIGARIVEMNRANILVADPAPPAALTARRRAAERESGARPGATPWRDMDVASSATVFTPLTARVQSQCTGSREVIDANGFVPQCSQSPDAGRASFPPPRRRRKRCCRSSTSR